MRQGRALFVNAWIRKSDITSSSGTAHTDPSQPEPRDSCGWHSQLTTALPLPTENDKSVYVPQ